MTIKDIFIKKKEGVSPLPDHPANQAQTSSSKVPDKMWIKCPGCKRTLLDYQIDRLGKVCPVCHHHFRLNAKERLKITVDEGSFTDFDFNIPLSDPLEFPEYKKKIAACKKLSGAKEAVTCGVGKIGGESAVVCVMDSTFFMGSMGYYVGECLTRSVEYATANRLPVIIFTASGGARMQEGIISLMQMAKVSGALEKHSEAGLLYITVITDPTTGGVTASFAMLGDIIIAEKGALIGFAGKRVIEQTIRQKLPPNFQTAEFAQSCGFVDIVTERSGLKNLLYQLLLMHGGKKNDNGK